MNEHHFKRTRLQQRHLNAINQLIDQLEKHSENADLRQEYWFDTTL